MGQNRDLSKFPNAITVLDNGNVGMGTTNPSSASGLAFVLNSGTAQGRICIKTSATGDASGDGLQIGMSGTSAFIEQRENDDLTLSTNATERIRILASGNVGIGTTSPSYKLSVANEMQVGAQGGSDFLYMSGGSGYGSKVRAYYANGSLNSEISGNGNTLLNLVTSNVGIGTSEPAFKLDVSESGSIISGTATIGSNMKGIRIYNTNSAITNNAIGLWFSTGPHQAGIASFRASAETTWETSLAFYTHIDTTSGLTDATEKMRISGQGYVTKPNQPFFQAYSTGGSWTTGQTVVWAATLNNIGNGYNTSNGRFTAPVSGVYLFRADFRAPNSSATNIIDIKSSSGRTTRYEVPAGGNPFHTTVAAIYKLNAGDYVYCEAAAGTLSPDANPLDRFEGYLLG